MTYSTRTRRGIAAMVVAVVSGSCGSITAAAPGDIYNLGTLGGGHSFGNAINNAGQVAGWSYTTANTGATSHAFRYSGTPGSGGVMEDLGTLSGAYSEAFGINDAGQVAGTAFLYSAPNDYDKWHAFRYTGTPGSGGALVDLGTLGGTSSNGLAVNQAGQVAGWSQVTGNAVHGFLYTGTPGSGGVMADLGTLGGPDSLPRDVNNAGQVTGESNIANGPLHAFLYTGTPGMGGAMADLGTLGGTRSEGHALNDAGQVTGTAYLDANVYHGFRYVGTLGSGGEMIDLGTLGGNSSGHDINDAGFIVGHSNLSAAAGGGSRHVLWLNDAANTIVDLDAWLDAINPAQGALWALHYEGEFGINNYGLITGTGEYNDGPGGLSDGYRAYILDASSLVPEPSGLSLLAIASPALLRRRRSVALV